MKEIKWILYTLYVAGYTSLIWANVMWKGIVLGPNDIPFGILFGSVWTFLNLAVIVGYLKKHWWESKIGR